MGIRWRSPTGGMREVTAVKLALLQASGPVATASDHTFREHLVLEAIYRAGEDFDRVVCVGDGPWDLRAAVATGSQFLGIGVSTEPFGPWYPRANLFASFQDIDPAADFSLALPPGHVEAEADTDGTFTARPVRGHQEVPADGHLGYPLMAKKSPHSSLFQ